MIPAEHRLKLKNAMLEYLNTFAIDPSDHEKVLAHSEGLWSVCCATGLVPTMDFNYKDFRAAMFRERNKAIMRNTAEQVYVRVEFK